MGERIFKSHGQAFIRESHIIESTRFVKPKTPHDPEPQTPLPETPEKSPLEQLQEDLQKIYKSPDSQEQTDIQVELRKIIEKQKKE